MLLRPHVFFLPAFAALFAACGSGSNGFVFGDEALQERAYQACMAEVAGETSNDDGPAAAAPTRANVSDVRLALTRSEDLQGALREQMRGQMRRAVASSRRASLARLRTQRCEVLRPPSHGIYADAGAAANAAEDTPAGASQVSATNNQVGGVDEADFVKNDNKHIYVANGSEVRIIEAWPAATTHQVARIAVPGTARKLFVLGDRLVVYAAIQPTSRRNGYESSYERQPARSSECTYGYDCIPRGDGTATAILFYDITDRAAPRLLRKVQSSSSLLSARRIGSAVHTVLASNDAVAFSAVPSRGSFASEEQLNRAYDELLAENERQIDELAPAAYLPSFRENDGEAAVRGDFFESELPDGGTFTTILSLDLQDATQLSASTILSAPGAVYASGKALYMAVPHRRGGSYGWYSGRSESELSTIHKFEVGASATGTRYLASGLVAGRALNQFAMDERDGFLRVATTTGRAPDSGTHSTLSVLAQEGPRLNVTGIIDGIAPTEDIRSVRFDGDRGFVVTFKKTDPLFVFDLADPRHPRVLGELKIPGFSTYMHMMDATHLLTIGYDTDDHGSFAYFDGVMLQIFDVSDPKNPRLAHKEIIGTRGSSSEALANHLAFNYFAPRKILALPMTICEGGDDGRYGSDMTFSGLMVYDVTATAGFSLRGKVAHPTTTSASSSPATWYDRSGCSNWWSNASSEVKRSIFMDDFVYSVSERRIKVNDTRSLSTDVATVSLEK